MRLLPALAVLVALAPAPVARADQDWVTDLVARADAIGVQVAKLRGLKIKRPIAKGVMTDEQLRERIVERMNEDSKPEERATEAAMAKRWGLVPMEIDLDKLLIELLTEQIAGFYDPKEGKLYISAKPEGNAEWPDMVMAHEITHALQDQHFGLEKWMEEVKGNGDASFARQALVEGDGVALMIEYSLAKQNLPPPWDHDELVRVLSGSLDAEGGGDLLGKAPLAIREAMIFPYRAGFGFVAALRRGQPWSKIDAAFKKPPRSTEQIIHPELYLAGEGPDVITAPAAPDQLHTGIWGEEGWRVFLRTHGVSPDMASSAAAGWGGDRVLLYGPPEAVATPARTTGVALTTWDSDADALEFWNALGRALDAMVVGTIVVDEPTRVVWLDVDGRVTTAELRGRQIAIVAGAGLAGWQAALAGAWRWKIAWAPGHAP
jgi:hypothetical protein